MAEYTITQADIDPNGLIIDKEGSYSVIEDLEFNPEKFIYHGNVCDFPIPKMKMQDISVPFVITSPNVKILFNNHKITNNSTIDHSAVFYMTNTDNIVVKDAHFYGFSQFHLCDDTAKKLEVENIAFN